MMTHWKTYPIVCAVLWELHSEIIFFIEWIMSQGNVTYELSVKWQILKILRAGHGGQLLSPCGRQWAGYKQQDARPLQVARHLSRSVFSYHLEQQQQQQYEYVFYNYTRATLQLGCLDRAEPELERSTRTENRTANDLHLSLLTLSLSFSSNRSRLIERRVSIAAKPDSSASEQHRLSSCLLWLGFI